MQGRRQRLLGPWYRLVDLLKEPAPGFIDLFYCFLSFYFIYFCSMLYYFLSFASLGFYLFFFF